MGDTVCQKNVRSLFDLSINCLTRNIQTLCTKTSKGFKLHAELALPKLICEKYIEMYQNIGGEIDDSFAYIFKNVTKTKLGSVSICNSSLSDNGLKFILRHNLNEITLENCMNLTQKTNFNIFKYSVNLRSLAIGSNVQIIPFSEVSNISLSLEDITEKSSGKALNLKHLVLRGIEDIPFAFPYLFSNNSLDKLLLLSVLDLSNCLSVGNLEYLRKFPNLHTLILFNVGQLEDNDALSHICSLRSLVVLDISQSYSIKSNSIFKNETQTLELIANCLPNLMYLDISGTNLVESEHFMREYGTISGIPGLECRIDNPLEFLGLYHTMHNICQRNDIPAKIISGHANENQILNAAVSCMGKPELLQDILMDFDTFFWCEQYTQIDQYLYIVLKSLTTYVKEIQIQRNGSGVLNYILRTENENGQLLLNDIKVKQQIITTIFSGMESHKYDKKIIQNGLRIFEALRIPQDVMFDWKRFLQILLHIITLREPHPAYIFYLFKLSVSNLSNLQKDELGDAGAIWIILEFLKIRFQTKIYDYTSECAWYIMYSLTKSVPTNCKRFLEGQGIRCFLGFLEVLKIFPVKNELMCNMMRVLCNVTEIKDFRRKLMKTNIIKILENILFSAQVGIEVRYAASRIISHLASDGDKEWTVIFPSRSNLLNRMTYAIQNWSLDSNFNMDYFSFKPILRLAQVRHTFHCQYWAVWTLAYLTKLSGDNCLILIAENGLRIMRELLDQHTISNQNQNSLPGLIHSLAQTVINQCKMYSVHKQY